MTTPLNMAIGGVIAAVLCVLTLGSIKRLARSDALGFDLLRPRHPPLWALLVLLYGLLASVVLFAVDARFFDVLSVPPMITDAVGIAVGWSMLLGVILATAWPYLPNRMVGPAKPLDILGFHLAYGVILGVWIRVTWLT